MGIKSLFPFTQNFFLLFLFIGIVLLPCAITFADKVVITPHEITAPVFHTSEAVCYGSYANTHINLGFGITSVTGLLNEDISFCTIGGGLANEATANNSTVGGGAMNKSYGGYSTVGGGASNKASGYLSIVGGGYANEARGNASTVGGGSRNTAAGNYSWAGGHNMTVLSTAYNTFVWGYSDSGLNISTPDAFIIFPERPSGKVGVGTKTPNNLLDLGNTIGKKLAVFQDSTGEDFYGFGISGYTLEFYAGATSGASPAMVVKKTTGNVGIGTTNPGYKLEVNGSAAKPGGGSWNVSSDERLKDITGDYEGGLKEIVELKPVTFYYKEGNPKNLPNDKEYVGFIAQEVQEIFPEAVSVGADGYLDFDMHPVNVALVNAVKELKAENETLRAESGVLKKDIEKIKKLLGL